MNIDTIVSRLQRVNNQLMTISSLRRIQGMSGKCPKLCTCAHHRSNSGSRSAGKCNYHAREKKKALCSCRKPPKLCLCSHGSDDPSITERSKKLDADEDTKQRPENSPHEKGKKKLIDRAVETQSTNDRKFSTFRTRKRLYEKPEKNDEFGANEALVLQPSNIENGKEFAKDDKMNEKENNIEQMYKELKKQNRELEEKLENMDCSMKCLKDEGDVQAACLKDALEKAKNEAKLAARSRNLAMDLAKQSREQTDLVKATREEIYDEMNIVKCNNSKLQCECDELRCKLKEIEENEAKKCAEVDDKVNKIKCAVKQKETVLISEKNELEKTLAELTNHVKIQKKRICDLTSVCTKQRDLLRENENCISTKIAQLTEAEGKFQSINCRCRQMQEQIDDLRCRLNEERIARDNLQKLFDERQDNCNCELQIRDKIIGDQVETIKKLKKLLQDSEKMAHQAAREFESLRDELRCLKQSNESLRIALDEAESQMSEDRENEICDRCNIVEARLNNLEKQKQKAIMAAKFAATKLCKCTTEYNRQIDCEKRRNEYMTELAERQEAEILLLKKEILCVKEFRSGRSKDYIDYQ